MAALVPVLTRFASGQRLTSYVSMITGPRQPGEVDGPDELHVVFLDHGRRALVGTPYEEMLACIRCGACLNVCPVYGKIGGHAYASVYSGPMGAVLTPLLSGGREGRELPEASSLCGACTEACPVGIPLADMLVRLRADLRPRRSRSFATWARVWSSPVGYRATTATARWAARLGTRGRRWTRRVPLLRGWSELRDVPLPAPRPYRGNLFRGREGLGGGSR